MSDDTMEVSGDDVAAVPDEWEWTPIEVVCGACGASNTIHEQKPEDLEAGVWWECSAKGCGARHLLKTEQPGVADGLLLECSACHRTFTAESDPQPEVGEDGSWACPGCSTVHHTAGESAGVETVAVKA